MTQSSASATSSGHYDPSPSFDAALAQVDLAEVTDEVQVKEPPSKRRRVAFRDDLEEVVGPQQPADWDEELQERDGSDLEELGELNEEDEEADVDIDNEGLPRISSSYLEDQAYNASKFGGFQEYFRHRRIKLWVTDCELSVDSGS